MDGGTSQVETKLAINGYEICYLRFIDLTKFGVVDPNPQLMCGGMDHLVERISVGPALPRFKVLCEPHPGEWDILLPLIGYNEDSTDTFTPTNTLTSFTTLFRRKTTDDVVVHTYANTKVSRAIVRGQKGGLPCTLELDCMALTMTEGASFSATSITAQAPYAFTAGALTMAGATTAFSQFAYIHDNHMQPLFNNDTAPTSLMSTQRTIHMALNTPYTDAEDGLLTTAIGASRNAGIAINLAFTNGSKRWIADITKAVWEGNPPSVLSKEEEVRMPSFWKAFKSGSNPIVTITQDNT